MSLKNNQTFPIRNVWPGMLHQPIESATQDNQSGFKVCSQKVQKIPYDVLTTIKGESP